MRLIQALQTGKAEFESFWQLYPRKTAKAHAKTMWDRLTQEEKNAALLAIPNHVEWWRMSGTHSQHIPHAGSWLNPKLGRRWEDEVPDWRPIGKETDHEKNQRAAREFVARSVASEMRGDVSDVRQDFGRLPGKI